ncbi:hypothetical protein PRUPE_2G046800 [Prunus persica]|uniref:Uncharacterized protein n=1 Tax=Prunus persica TaxID=3760 RepID=A0A251QED2_PRUPE|nr:hypothetical protein PRUPE_2G046800 [Prunus persica]
MMKGPVLLVTWNNVFEELEIYDGCPGLFSLLFVLLFDTMPFPIQKLFRMTLSSSYKLEKCML